MSRPLAVDAELTLTHDGEEISVWDDEDALVVDVPSYGAARALLRTITTSPLPPAELFAGATTAGDSEATDGGTAAFPDPETTTDETDGPVTTAGDLDLEAALDRHDLTVEVRVRYATVARLGAGADPSGWERRLGARLLPVPAAIRFRGVVVAAARCVG